MRFGGTYSSSTQNLLQEEVQLLLFYWRQRVDCQQPRLQTRNVFDGMVPLPVLWEDVEVFLGKYKFESFSTVRWGERSSLCFQESTGSFCKFLGDHGDGM